MALATAVLLGAASPAAASPTSGGDVEPDAELEPDTEVEEPDPAEVAREEAQEALEAAVVDLGAARDALRTRLDAVEQARRSGRAADGEVRRAEAPLVDAVTAVIAAADELVAVQREIRRLERERDRLEVELDHAQEVLGGRAVQAFKSGTLGELSGPVALVREARDPGELAHHLGHLRGLTRDGARTVTEVTAALAQVEVDLDDARDTEVTAVTALEDAEVAREGAEATAAAARQRAADAESRLLAQLDGELAARDRVGATLEALVEATTAAAAADVAAARTEAARIRGEEVAETVASDGDTDRSEEVAGRRRAHQRQVALPAEHRRVADAWRCPVAGGRFVNDWSFPRSGDRRHEGTDVFAARGTDIVALGDGIVTAVQRLDRPGSLGGRTVSVTTPDDHRHYYAHLETIPADLAVGAAVAAGDLIGTVGTTGNARGTPPHLHLGWYVRGTAVNPYASLVVACRDADRDA